MLEGSFWHKRHVLGQQTQLKLGGNTTEMSKKGLRGSIWSDEACFKLFMCGKSSFCGNEASSSLKRPTWRPPIRVKLPVNPSLMFERGLSRSICLDEAYWQKLILCGSILGDFCAGSFLLTQATCFETTSAAQTRRDHYWNVQEWFMWLNLAPRTLL